MNTIFSEWLFGPCFGGVLLRYDYDIYGVHNTLFVSALHYIRYNWDLSYYVSHSFNHWTQIFPWQLKYVHLRYHLVKEPLLGFFSICQLYLMIQRYSLKIFSAINIAFPFPPQIPLGEGTLPWLQLRHAINLHKVFFFPALDNLKSVSHHIIIINISIFTPCPIMVGLILAT